MEGYTQDVKQYEKHVPDLLEPIMRPPGLVKEELRLIFFKIGHFRSNIENRFQVKLEVSSFWVPEIRWIPVGGQCQSAR